jgi:hypothetical protein
VRSSGRTNRQVHQVHDYQRGHANTVNCTGSPSTSPRMGPVKGGEGSVRCVQLGDLGNHYLESVLLSGRDEVARDVYCDGDLVAELRGVADHGTISMPHHPAKRRYAHHNNPLIISPLNWDYFGRLLHDS